MASAATLLTMSAVTEQERPKLAELTPAYTVAESAAPQVVDVVETPAPRLSAEQQAANDAQLAFEQEQLAKIMAQEAENIQRTKELEASLPERQAQALAEQAAMDAAYQAKLAAEKSTPKQQLQEQTPAVGLDAEERQMYEQQRQLAEQETKRMLAKEWAAVDALVKYKKLDNGEMAKQAIEQGDVCAELIAPFCALLKEQPMLSDEIDNIVFFLSHRRIMLPDSAAEQLLISDALKLS